MLRLSETDVNQPVCKNSKWSRVWRAESPSRLDSHRTETEVFVMLSVSAPHIIWSFTNSLFEGGTQWEKEKTIFSDTKFCAMSCDAIL